MHPADYYLLGIKWRDKVYINHCIPLWSLLHTQNFSIYVLANHLAWIMEYAGVSYLIHYLDGYLTMGPPKSAVCQQNLNILYHCVPN